MRHLLAFTAATILASGPVLADAPGTMSGAGLSPSFRPGHHGHRPAYGARRIRVRGYGYGFAANGPVYGPEPPYFDGTGAASPSGGYGDAPIALSLYREAYIGRGLIYNVPPQPFLRSSNVISVRY